MKANGRAALALFLLLVAAPPLAAASGWGSYGNARFGYWLDVPPGFSDIAESQNGDGGSSLAVNGQAQLRVWGSYLTEDSFAADVAWRIGEERRDGWDVTYSRETPDWAVWSGSKGGRILYERGIPVCDGAVAYFRLEYDRAAAAAFDPIISRLARSLRSGGC